VCTITSLRIQQPDHKGVLAVGVYIFTVLKQYCDPVVETGVVA
jgi:hypothetical protein